MAKRFLLIRVTDGKAAVVAGPLKENQLVPSNPIPPRVERLLDQAETFELFALDPRSSGKATPSTENFHEWRVLGKTEVKEPADRKKLVDALRLGAEDNAGTVDGFFIPRHGLRLTSGKETVDLVICFQCLSIQVYVNGNMAKGFLTTGDPQKEFDALLNGRGREAVEAGQVIELGLTQTIHSSGASSGFSRCSMPLAEPILATPDAMTIDPTNRQSEPYGQHEH